MARSEARVFTSIWRDPDFRELTSSAQWMYLFLLSQGDLAFSGVLPLRPGKWAPVAPDRTVAKINADLKVLGSARFVVADDATSELLVRSFVRRDGILRSPKLMKPLAAALAAVESQKLRDVLALELERAVAEGDVNVKLREEVERMVKMLSSQVNTLSDTLFQETPIPYGVPHGIPTGVGEGEVVGLTEPRTKVGQRGSRIPDDFAVTPAMVTWARAKCPHVDGKRETEKFVNHWTAAAGPSASKKNWEAAWRNWMLYAAERTARPVLNGSTGQAVSIRDEHRLRR
jgi:hypothetical protein